MEKRTKVIIGIGFFIIFFLALTLKFSGDSDNGLNEYEETFIIEEVHIVDTNSSEGNLSNAIN
ncbi:unnamed protein product, partial [marine sediment metagenome]